MDAENGGKAKFRISSRSMMLALGVLTVLTVSVVWSVRQSRLTQEALHRAVAAEQAATQAQANTAEPHHPLRGRAKILRDEALQRAARRSPKDVERVGHLYQELDSLMQIQNRIQQDLQTLRRQRPKPDAAATGNTRPVPGSDPAAGLP